MAMKSKVYNRKISELWPKQSLDPEKFVLGSDDGKGIE